MRPVAILMGLELGLIAAAFVVGRGDVRRTALVLVSLSAPLEVYRTPIAGYNVSLFRLSLLLVVVSLCIRERQRILTAVRHWAVAAYCVLALVMAISYMTLGENDFLGRRVLGQVVVGIVAIAIVAYLAQRQPPRVVLGALVAGALLPLLAATFQGLSNLWGSRATLPLVSQLPAAEGLEPTRTERIFTGSEGVRLQGTFGDPNHFGTYMALVAVVAVALGVNAVARREWRQAVTLGAVCVGGISIIAASYSRTAWLALACALGILLVSVVQGAASGTLGPIAPRHLLAVGLAALVFLAPLTPRVAARLDPQTTSTQASNSVHAHTSEEAIDTLADNPLFGIGQSDLGRKLGQKVRTSGAHSSYLTFGAELGLVGLLVVAFAVVVVLRPPVRAARRTARESDEWLVLRALVALYCGFLAANITYDVWLDDFHWLFIGAIVGICARLWREDGAPTEASSGRRSAADRGLRHVAA